MNRAGVVHHRIRELIFCGPVDKRNQRVSEITGVNGAVLQKTKASLVTASRTKSDWTAPIYDFIVSDDDIDTDSDTDNEPYDSASPLQMIRGTSGKENKPVCDVPGYSSKPVQKERPTDTINSDVTSSKPGIRTAEFRACLDYLTK